MEALLEGQINEEVKALELEHSWERSYPQDILVAVVRAFQA